MPTYFKLDVIQARKNQVCQLCGKTIEPKEFYHRINFGARGNVKVCQKKHPIKIKAERVLRED